jgi:sialate O-acetylesterase
MSVRSWVIGLIAGVVVLSPGARADVKPNALISDGMVLQRGMRAPIWGTADDGEAITVRIQDREAKTVAKDGRWRVDLEELKEGGPYEMTIAGKNQLQFHNVLVGEVWIASGQSNMEWPLSLTIDPLKTVADTANPKIRLFTVPKRPSATPERDVHASWQECSPMTARGFSAVAYFFGRDLEKSLHVPIGLIHTSWGGTPAESWTGQPALEAEPSLKYLAERQQQALADYPKVRTRYIADLQKHLANVTRAEAAGKDLPNPPAPPVNPARNAWGASTLYNGMIAPLIPYAFRGAIWYQGESNAGRAYEYRTLLPAMIKNWRADWKEGDFPFLIVQLAPFGDPDKEPKDSEWAELREAQLLTTKTLPNTAEAVIVDVGDPFDIHPRQKEPVGGRLALAARALAYGEKVEYSGPAYENMKTEGSKIALSFSHAGGGLVAKGDALTGFAIAGADRKFVPAEAKFEGEQVVVWNPRVEQPVAVRYGWANYPVVNLYNQAGLPASPFRTDDFPMRTNPHANGSTSGTR